MGAKERLLAIKLFEQVGKRPEFAKEIGLNVAIKNKNKVELKDRRDIECLNH